MSWLENLKLGDPCWDDCRDALTRFEGSGLPGVEQLNSSLHPPAKSGGGHSIRFIESSDLQHIDYESHIYLTGQVSTRHQNWHDLFNATCWHAWPAIKAAMNFRHYHARAHSGNSERGAGRDALTLFDECGAVVISSSHSGLEHIARHQWDKVFRDQHYWQSQFQVFLTGHAMLEKCLKPYKAMTANALLVEVSPQVFKLARPDLRNLLDEKIALLIKAGLLLEHSGQLAPLPLSGIPGWWSAGPQDAGFYDDVSVFRPMVSGREVSPVIRLEEGASP